MSKSSTALLALGLVLASFSAQAQMADRLSERPLLIKSAMPDEAIALTREMSNRLHLNEGQFLKLLPLNRTKLAGLNSISREFRNDATKRAGKAAELEAQYEQECSRILSPSQLSQLQQAQGQPAPGTDNHLG